MADARMLIASVIAASLATPTLAMQSEPKPAAVAVPGYTMPSTQMWDMRADNGEIYRIFVSYPAVEPPPEGWPVLYVLDGNAMFAGFAEARRIQEWYDPGKSIVVGVGYPTDQAYDTRRLYDFTAAPPIPVPAGQRQPMQYRSGGRDKFLAFLTEELRAEIGKRHKINLERQSLFGHSLGGLFALHALYTRPDAFHAIVAASPSLWWNEQAMLRQEREFAARLTTGKVPKASRLLLVVGDREESILNTWDSEAFAKRLEPMSAYGLRARYIRYDGEGHMTVPVRAVADALRFVASWP